MTLIGAVMYFTLTIIVIDVDIDTLQYLYSFRSGHPAPTCLPGQGGSQ